MLPNEEFALACRAYYEEIGLIVDKTNGEFAHCPYPEEMGESGYYLLWEHHQQQGILQSRDVGRCCFFNNDARIWLLSCDPFPDNYFELWEIYEKYSGDNLRKILKKIHSEKDDDGKSIHARRIHQIKDELGRSINGVENGKRLHEKKDELGRSVNSVKAAAILNSQLWESTEDGFRSNSGNVARHNKANGWDPKARTRVK